MSKGVSFTGDSKVSNQSYNTTPSAKTSTANAVQWTGNAKANKTMSTPKSNMSVPKGKGSIDFAGDR